MSDGLGTAKKLSWRKRTVQKLLARDGNLCWLCGEPFSKRWGRTPSLDHVIPLSKGGRRRSLGNIKLAHWLCNNERGDRDIILTNAEYVDAAGIEA